MEQVFFDRGHLRSTKVRFAIVPGGHIRLKSGPLPEGSIVVDGSFFNGKPRVKVARVERKELVRVGKATDPFKRSAVYDVVKSKLLEMPSNVYVFAVELAWRSILARKALEV